MWKDLLLVALIYLVSTSVIGQKCRSVHCRCFALMGRFFVSTLIKLEEINLTSQISNLTVHSEVHQRYLNAVSILLVTGCFKKKPQLLDNQLTDEYLTQAAVPIVLFLWHYLADTAPNIVKLQYSFIGLSNRFF